MQKRYKSFWSVLLCLAMLLGYFAFSPDLVRSVLAKEPDSVDGIYQLSSVDDLLWAAQNPDKNYILTKDIDLSGVKNWTPIGSESKPFSGVFNGMGHTITLGIDQDKP